MIMLPTDLAANYPNDGSDPSIRLHQEHHDAIHAAVNASVASVVKASTEWAESDVVLQSGQLGLAPDTGEIRPGNGTAKWASLPSPGDDKVVEGTLVLNLRKQPGISGDGLSDDSSAINKAATAAANLGLRLFATGTFRILSTVTLIGDTDLSGALFEYYGSGIAVQLGGSPGISRKTIVLPKVRCGSKQTRGWIAGTVGVKAINLGTCFVTITGIENFETGLYVYGRGGGTAYCTFQVGHLWNNKRNMVLGADAGGWSNQNTFIGGRYSHNSVEGENVPGTRHILLETTAHPVNNNTWLNPSVEGNTVEEQIDVDGGRFNHWINPRLERSLGGRVRWGATANRNVIQGGYQAGSATITRIVGESRNVTQSSDRFEMYGASEIAVTRLQNVYSDASGVLSVYGASSLADADYRWRWSANMLEAKRATEPYPRLILDGINGRHYFGTGAVQPAAYLGAAGTAGVSINGGALFFGSDNSCDIGASAGFRPRDVHVARDVRVGGALAVTGKVGFSGNKPVARPVVRGSRGGSAALGSLIGALATLGLVTDKTTA